MLLSWRRPMKYLLILSLLSVPAFAQESSDETSTTTDESIEKKQQKVPENAEERKQKQEEEAELGPYDREGNYRIKLKPKDSDLPTD